MHDERREKCDIAHLQCARLPVMGACRTHQLEIAGAWNQRLAAAHTVFVEQPMRGHAEARFVDPLLWRVLDAALDQRMADRCAGALAGVALRNAELLRQRGSHADFLPLAPVDGIGWGPVARETVLGIGIEEGIGSRVVDLPGQTRERTDRREQHHEVEWRAPQLGRQRRLQGQRALQLGGEYRCGGSRVLERDHAVVQHAGGM